MDIYFFFDEAFHDRKITFKNGRVNCRTENASDIYVGVFMGISSNLYDGFQDTYFEFENNYKKQFSIPEKEELKGTTFKKRYYSHGLTSFSKYYLSFYKDYFKILKNFPIRIQTCLLSKTAYLLGEPFAKLTFDPGIGVNVDVFRYTLTKFLYNYQNNPLMEKLFEQDGTADQFLLDLKQFIKNILTNESGLPRKELEEKSLSDLLFVLDHSKVLSHVRLKYEWDYEPAFCGFDLFLYEKKISKCKVNLFIDREEKTFLAAQTHDYFRVEEADSVNCIGVRCSDILSNFIGRLIVAISENLYEGNFDVLEDITREKLAPRKLLDSAWFNLSEERFELYNLMHQVLCLDRKEFWSSYSDIYFDYSALFHSLLNYIGQYKNYSDFQKHEPLEHTENYNQFVMAVLNQHYKYFYE